MRVCVWFQETLVLKATSFYDIADAMQDTRGIVREPGEPSRNDLAHPARDAELSHRHVVAVGDAGERPLVREEADHFSHVERIADGLLKENPDRPPRAAARRCFARIR